MKRLLLFLLVILSLILSACGKAPVSEGSLEVQDFGTTGFDGGNEVAALPGEVGAVVVGETTGNLDGVNKGFTDAFIRRYDGGVVWAQQFGTRSNDSGTDVALHSSGAIYVMGQTNGALGFKVGSQDVFLRRYSSTGAVVWTRQFGTIGFDQSINIIVAGNFIYTLSDDSDTSFTIRKWNASGSLLLTIREINDSITNTSSLALDSLGNMYVVTQYNTGIKNVARLFSYNSTGEFLSQKTIFNPTGNAAPYDLIIDSSNNLYLSVNDDATGKGAYLRKLSTAGTSIWTKRLEPATSNSVIPNALALDSSNNVYVAGYVFLEAFPGFSNAGTEDIFTLKYSPAGARLWAYQKGGTSTDYGFSIAVSDAVYVTGYSFSNPNLVGDSGYGSADAFLMQLDTSGNLMGIDQ